MSFDRRDFLRHAALGAAGLAVGNRAEAAAPSRLVPFDASDPERFWREVRNQYSLSRTLTYFNTGGLGPAPSPVLAVATDTTRQLQEKSEHGHGLLAGARATIAGFLGGAAEEIAFVRNASEGNSIVAAGLKLAPGDEVIFETHAHPGGSFPWLNQEKLRGVVVKLFEPATTSGADNVARIAALITPRTRVVQVSHVTAPTGIRLPVGEIGAWCRERGIWFHVDGAQSAGMIPIALRQLACDSFATSGHKWLGAPHETGMLWIKRERLDEVAPTLVGAYSADLDHLPGELKLTATAMRFEYGTRNAAAILALAEATRFQEQIGRERIAARGRALSAQLRAGLSRLPGVEILTPEPAEMSGSMLTFRTEKVPYDQLFSRLMKDGAIRCRPVSEQKLNALRVSTHVFNTPGECDALIAGVKRILQAG